MINMSLSKMLQYCHVIDVQAPSPPSDNMCYGDCLEDNGEDCQNCSVLYCVTHLCTIMCTLL